MVGSGSWLEARTGGDFARPRRREVSLGWGVPTALPLAVESSDVGGCAAGVVVRATDGSGSNGLEGDAAVWEGHFGSAPGPMQEQRPVSLRKLRDVLSLPFSSRASLRAGARQCCEASRLLPRDEARREDKGQEAPRRGVAACRLAHRSSRTVIVRCSPDARITTRVSLRVEQLLQTIEAVSPPNPHYDYQTKRRLYLQNGVPEYWVVHSDARNISRCLGRDDSGRLLSHDVSSHPGGIGGATRHRHRRAVRRSHQLTAFVLSIWR